MPARCRLTCCLPPCYAVPFHKENTRFADLAKLRDAYFGEPRQKGASHRVYRTPWPGDPRGNIQSAKGKAKPYQVRQVIKAVEKLEGRQ